MFYQRHADEAILKLSGMFGAVLVTGARQTGKTTLLKEITGSVEYVTLDDTLQLVNASGQAGTFFLDHPPPVFVDEIQYAPSLFTQIKLILDRKKRKGQFFLSGSQTFEMMKHVSESLAGRVGILNLPGLSLREIYGVSTREPFLPTDAFLACRQRNCVTIPYGDVWRILHRGSYPELCAHTDFDWQMYYAAYVRTYIERDVRSLSQVGDETKFIQFLTIAASRTGQLLNLNGMARDVGISQPTAERWLSVLAASNIIFLVKPYSNNMTKRMVKTPKLYFMDTGLAAYLTRWTDADVLRNGAMAGAFFETFVVNEIAKSYLNRGILDVPVYFLRDRDGHEIDLLIENSGTLYPIEIKKHADPTRSDIASFNLLDKIPGMKRGPGGVVCLYDRLNTLQGNDRVIPICLL
jgi:predicted AAA+ superfamily ATPase